MELAKIESECIKGPRGCWYWTGVKKVRINRLTYSMPRLMYAMFVGSVYPGDKIIRACGNKMCVNPAHLLKVGVDEIESIKRW